MEINADENSAEVMNILKSDGYEISLNHVDCSGEQAKERMLERANTDPTPADNLWCSMPNPEFPDKYDYQDMNPKIFRQEYAKRKRRAQSSDEPLR